MATPLKHQCWGPSGPGTWEHIEDKGEHRVRLSFGAVQAVGFGPTRSDALEGAWRNYLEKAA